MFCCFFCFIYKTLMNPFFVCHLSNFMKSPFFAYLKHIILLFLRENIYTTNIQYNILMFFLFSMTTNRRGNPAESGAPSFCYNVTQTSLFIVIASITIRNL